MSETKHAIVLGATSLVGAFLCERLAAAGYTGECISRNPSANHSRPQLPFCWRRLDVQNPDDWQASPGAVVVSLLPLWALPQLLSRLQDVRQIIAVSTTSVFTKAHSADPEERDLVNRTLRSEQALLRFCTRARLDWTILRPTLVYGAGRDRNISAIARFARRFGVFPVARPACGLRQPIHADDVAQAIVASIDNPRARNEAFNLTGGETLTYRDMVRRIFEAAGRRPVIVALPSWLLSLVLRLARLVSRSLYSPALFDRMNQDLTFDSGAARAALGFDPRPFLPELDDSASRREGGV